MTFKEFLYQQWKAVALFLLFLLLIASHAFMIHYHRPDAIITWCENMISGTFGALIAILSDRSSNTPSPPTK